MIFLVAALALCGEPPPLGPAPLATAGAASTSDPDDASAGATTSDEGETHVDGTAAAWLELDTNAKRLPSGAIGGDDGHLEPPLGPPAEEPSPDGLVRAEGAVSASVKRGSVLVRSDDALGFKGFFTQSSEDMLVVQSRDTVSAPVWSDAVLSLSLFGKGRAQLSGVRTYGVVDGAALVQKPLLRWLSVRAGVDGQAFHSFDVPLFSSAGGGVLAGAEARAGPESLDLLVDAGGRGFPFASKNLEDPGDPERRTDGVVVATLQATSARRLFLSAGYTLWRNASNARGESFLRHRLSAVVGFRLPAQLTCTAQGTLQITQYDDGVSVGQIYFLGDDEESQNILEVTLSRPLIGPLSAVARVAFTGNELAVEGARFSRETAALGLQATY